MRALKAAVIIMGVLIVAGVAVIIATILQRTMGGTTAGVAEMLLDEPAGTRILGAAGTPDRLAVTLSGGGPDRVVIVDTVKGKVTGKVSLGK